jgi:hypothetical protein
MIMMQRSARAAYALQLHPKGSADTHPRGRQRKQHQHQAIYIYLYIHAAMYISYELWMVCVSVYNM